MSLYDIKVNDIDGDSFDLNQFKGKVVVIANTASKCGFTPQYKDLEKIYNQYKDDGLVVIGAPCGQFADQELSTGGEVKSFCELNYGVTFPLLEKMDVRGQSIHPLFKFLTEQAGFKGFDNTQAGHKMLQKVLEEKFPELLHGDGIKWNFTKFLIDRDGNVVKRFESPVDPLDMVDSIKALL